MTISSANQYRRMLYALLACVSVFGCAFSNEGAVDYRRAESFSLVPVIKRAAGKDPLQLSPLLMKDVASSDSNAAIETHDKISIRLRDGFLRSCNEKSVNPLRGFRKNCEIAILFKAFELGNGQDFRFQPGAEREARLVYFSHDVDAGQHFNLHNMAVYGPIEYKGRPLALDIYILELDAEDAQTSALLKTLASIGATAYAPAAPVLGLLEKLGASLLNSGTDDTEFRYSLVLDSSGGYSGTAHATAEAGDYAFIREEDRLHQTLWSNLYLDHNTGRIWTRSSEKDEPRPYTTNTYLTVQVLKNAGTDSIELDQNTFGAFRDALDRDTSSQVKQLEEALLPQLKSLSQSRVRTRNFNRAQKLYERLLADLKQNDTPGAASKAFELCQIVLQSASAVNSKDETLNDTANLEYEQIEYFLRRIRTRAKFQDPDVLTAFSAKGSSKLTLKQCMDAAIKAPI